MVKSYKFLVILLFLIPSCFQTGTVIRGKGDIKLKEIAFEDLRGWQETNQRQALLSFLNSCKKIATLPQSRSIGGQIGDITAADFRDVCEIGEVVKGLSDHQVKNFFENWFKPYLITDRKNNERGLFTGYYEASLNGSRIKTDIYKYPIYKKPTDLTSEPYFTRKEIEDGILKNKDLEILYVDNPVDLFFTHIQGSARIKLPSGAVLRLAYAGKNNQPFTPISTYLLDNNFLTKREISAQNIVKWLKENPEVATEAMNFNSSYIFFEISNKEHVVGAQGVELTKEHSLAVDSQVIPYGLPLWLETSINGKNFNSLMVAQDTGSAIKGTIRGDIFFGYGDDAYDKASSMSNFGKYYALLPRNITAKLMK